LGPSGNLRQGFQIGGCVGLVMLIAVLVLVLRLVVLRDQLFDLENPPAILDPHNLDLTLKLSRHLIPLTAAGTSRMCRCFGSGLTERQRMVSFEPLLHAKTVQVVKSISLFVTTSQSAVCMGGSNFDCVDHYGATASVLVGRWDSGQSTEPRSFPLKTGLRLLDGAAGGLLVSRSSSSRLMVAVEYNLANYPILMNPVVWQGRSPDSSSGVRVSLRDVQGPAIEDSIGQFSVAAVGFTVPPSNPSFTANFSVAFDGAAPWVGHAMAPGGPGWVLVGAMFTMRDLGTSVTARITRGNGSHVASLSTPPASKGRDWQVRVTTRPSLPALSSLAVYSFCRRTEQSSCYR
jgi:hypothetical protein